MTGFVISNAQLLDLAAGELRPGASLRVEGERIVEVCEDGRAMAPGELQVIDAGGRTLMPGLIDAHVHAGITTMDFGALFRRQSSWRGIETKFVLEAMLQRGFTSVRDAGGLDPGISSALDAGLIRGPRVFRSGRPLSQTGGHGDSEPTVSEHPTLCACSIRSNAFSHVADGVEAVRRAAREELKSGAHQLKVMAGGGVITLSDPIDMVQYSEAEIRVAVEEARSRHTYAFAHAYIPEAIQRAVAAGVRSIEHGNLIDRPSAELMARMDCYLVPTIVTYHQLAEHGPAMKLAEESLAKVHEVIEAAFDSIDIALSCGVKLGFGTDLLGELHPMQSHELLLRGRVQTPRDVILSATATNAALLQRPSDLGVVAPGALADLLLVNGNPLADLSVLSGQGEHIDLIVRGGTIYKNSMT